MQLQNKTREQRTKESVERNRCESGIETTVKNRKTQQHTAGRIRLVQWVLTACSLQEDQIGRICYSSCMKKKKKPEPFPFPAEFRKQGSITYHGKPVDLWISRKTGELGFSIQDRAVQDTDLYTNILTYLQSANRES